MAIQARIPVRIYYDDEAKNWHFHVPELHIVGGGQRTHDEARQAAAAAIAFVLESKPDTNDGKPFEYLDVTVG
jgi:predicted RNase H-like HicB family nuclease